MNETRLQGGMTSTKMNSSKWLEVQVVTLSYRGHNCREISDKLQVSLGKVSKILHKLNLQAKEEIKSWIDYRTPFEYQKSLMLLEYITKKAIEIVSANSRSTTLAKLSVTFPMSRKASYASGETPINLTFFPIFCKLKGYNTGTF